MNKAFENFTWENEPSVNSPLNEDNLNKINRAVNEIDNRVITLDTTKANTVDIQKSIVSIEFEESTGVFRFTRKDGSSFRIDTKLEKVPLDYTFNADTQQLVITNTDGTTQSIDISSFITILEFLASDTITPTIEGSSVSFDIVKGSINEEYFEPNYLSEIKLEVAKAESASESAQRSEQVSVQSADTAIKSNQDTKDLIDIVNQKLEVATFSLNEKGELVYTDNTSYQFTVEGNTGLLHYNLAEQKGESE